MAGSSQRALKAWADKKFKERRLKRGCNKTQRRLKGHAKKIQRRFTGDITQEAQRRFKGELKEAHTRTKGGWREIQKRLKRKVKEAQRKLRGSSKEAQERLKGDRKKGEKKFKRGSKEAQKGPQKLQRNFFVASAFRPVWPGRCDFSFICIPQSTRALDQGGVEPRQAVSPKALRPWTIPLRYSVGSQKLQRNQ